MIRWAAARNNLDSSPGRTSKEGRHGRRPHHHHRRPGLRWRARLPQRRRARRSAERVQRDDRSSSRCHRAMHERRRRRHRRQHRPRAGHPAVDLRRRARRDGRRRRRRGHLRRSPHARAYRRRSRAAGRAHRGRREMGRDRRRHAGARSRRHRWPHLGHRHRGLALGSGSGWLERKYGFTCDNLVKAEVVTADGRQVVASEDENPDLFWGLRGGGGNFGVVTAFHLRVHPVGPIVLAGQLMYPAEMAGDMLRFYREFILAARDEVCGGVAFITAPPEEFVPEPVRGQPVVGVVVLYAGDVAEGEEAFRPLREFGPPGLDMVQPMPYVAVQQMLDAANQSGRLNYWTADFYDSLPDEAIDTFVPRATHPISPLSQVIVMPGGGALSRVPQEATAFPQRNAEWNLHYLSMWEDPAETDHNISWTRDFSAAMKPWSSGRQYLNMLDEDRVERVAAAYGPEKFAELQALKAKWDPANLFCHNQTIPPAGRRESTLFGDPHGHLDGPAGGEPTAGRRGPRLAGEGDLAHAELLRMADEPRRHGPAPSVGDGHVERERAELPRQRLTQRLARRLGRADVDPAAEPGGDLARGRLRDCPRLQLPLRVRVRRAAALHALRRRRDRQRLPAGNPRQASVEGARRVVRGQDLGRRAPALGRPLLEQPQRVPVAVIEVVELRLLERRGQRDRHRVVGHPQALADGGDRRRVRGLLRAHREGGAVERDPAARRDVARVLVPSRREGDVADGRGHDDHDSHHAPASAPDHRPSKITARPPAGAVGPRACARRRARRLELVPCRSSSWRSPVPRSRSSR